jgi:hypothetical protein
VVDDLEGEREDILVAHVEAPIAHGAQPVDELFLLGRAPVRLGRHDTKHPESADLTGESEPSGCRFRGGPFVFQANRSVYPTESGSEPHPNSPGSPISTSPPE